MTGVSGMLLPVEAIFRRADAGRRRVDAGIPGLDAWSFSWPAPPDGVVITITTLRW
ncbi:MAG TPA: hypothetical protein VGG23_02080 [Acidimicrobiales bacterium]|jgi:hypothetical protein